MRSRQKPAIDEKRRGGVDSERAAGNVVSLDVFPELAGVEALVERARIETEIRGEAFQVGRGERALVLENRVVILPELALLVGAKRRLGRGRRLRVIRQREVTIDEANFVAVSLFNLLKGRTDPCAERSLKVRVLDDRDLSVRRPLDPLVSRDGDRNPRGLESNRDVGVRA